MKFFGWGKRKDPPPAQPAYQDLKNSVPFSDIAARSSQSPRPEAGYGTGYGGETVGQEDQTLQQRATSPRPWTYFLGEAGDVGSETWEERLQETIRFVFSHEQEGLLTIGTFALDQLAGVTNHIKPPAPDHHSVSSVQMAILEVRSPDDKIDLQQSVFPCPIPAPCRRNLELYPIVNDHDARISCRLLSLGSTKAVDTCNDLPSCADSTKGQTHAVAGIKQVVLPTTDTSEVFDKSDSEDFYSPGVCSLFASRSRRTQKSAKENPKKLPQRRTEHAGASEQKRTGSGKGSLGAQLGRLWRSGRTRSAPPEVPPEKKLPPDHKESQAQDLQGPPCIANVEEAAAAGVPKPSQAWEAGKQRKRRGHSFRNGWPCASNGKWIRTDTEFVVLEM